MKKLRNAGRCGSASVPELETSRIMNSWLLVRRSCRTPNADRTPGLEPRKSHGRNWRLPIECRCFDTAEIQQPGIKRESLRHDLVHVVVFVSCQAPSKMN